MTKRGDELRARRLAQQIASIGVLEERIRQIVVYGNARYQEGVEDATEEEEEPPKQPNESP